jgi:hypothetical protein
MKLYRVSYDNYSTKSHRDPIVHPFIDDINSNLAGLQRQIHHIEILSMREINITKRTQAQE